MGIRWRAGRATGGQRCKISLATARWNPCAARSPLFVLSRAGDYSLKPRCGTTERCKRSPCNNPQTMARRQRAVRIEQSPARPETGPPSQCSESTSAFGGTADIAGLTGGPTPSRMTHIGRPLNITSPGLNVLSHVEFGQIGSAHAFDSGGEDEQSCATC